MHHIYILTLSYTVAPRPVGGCHWHAYYCSDCTLWHLVRINENPSINSLGTKWDIWKYINRAEQKSSALHFPLLFSSEMLRTVWLRLPNFNRSFTTAHFQVEVCDRLNNSDVKSSGNCIALLFLPSSDYFIEWVQAYVISASSVYVGMLQFIFHNILLLHFWKRRKLHK